ncbi:hypothetical protein CEXT_78621 [Caerostris extrusa]|uniref:Uncharacterized protein n=1 Tax=Caerostris extrusa TaxID=172846 RepID=A0AAV4MBF3_CAEEX|nr:hypothetical protein CEXT_78621 [Caerostris extrusa]
MTIQRTKAKLIRMQNKESSDFCLCRFSDDQPSSTHRPLRHPPPKEKLSLLRVPPSANLQLFFSIIGFKYKNWSMELTFDTGSKLTPFFSLSLAF